MAENKKIFFRPAEKFVKNEISDREVQYGAAKRAGFHSKRDHASFLHGKTGWATAKSGDKILENSKQDLFESYYQRESSGNYIPRPGLIDVNVRHDGDYGTLQRATVNFIVFNINQLEDMECAFLSVGRDVTIEYGWSVGGRSDGDSKANRGKFVGIINNFSFTLNKEGGFDCTFEAVGEGYNTLGYDPVSMGGQSESVTSEDESGIPDTPFTGIIKLIRNEINDKSLSTHGAINPDGTIVGFELGFTFTSVEDSSGDNATTNAIRYYTTLGHLINTINSEILRKTNSTNKFICNDKTTVGHRDPWIKSPATQHIIYPSKTQGNYDPKVLGELGKNIPQEVLAIIRTDLTSASGKEKFRSKDEVKLDFSVDDKLNFEINEKEVDLSKILINLDTIQTIKNQLVQDKETNTTVKNLLTRLFDLIRTCSGNAYDLNIIPDPENPKDMLIVNGKYTETVQKSEWVIFKPFTTRSVVRDVSLSGQIPDELSAVAYVAGRNGDANTNQYPEHLAKMLSGGQCNGNNQQNATEADVPGSGVLLNTPINAAQSTADAPLDSNVNKQIQDQQKAKEANDIKNRELANLYVPIFVCFLLGPRQYIDFEKMKELIYYTSAQSIGITGFPSLITRSAGKTKWNANVAIPLNFSVTLDGINGFRFGDVITTTYMPSKYTDGKSGFLAAFTITKVNHTISNNDWTTQLETVCRLVDATEAGN